MSLESCLARIDERDAEIHAWTWVDRSARSSAGLLEGVVVGVKDVIDVAAMPTAYGSAMYADNVAKADAAAVARLRAAGAVILGKTVTAEFATYHPGPTVNPRKAGHTPGGSSSGSAAAVADGQADLALGTQTAGSMIRPASFCGTLGFKPSFGRYPLGGVLETAPSLDTLGVFARDLDLLVLADGVLSAEHKPLPPTRDPVIGVCRSPAWREADGEMQAKFLAYADRLASMGLSLRDVDLPSPLERLADAQALIHRREAWVKLGHLLHAHRDALSDELRSMLELGRAETDSNYNAALELQAHCRSILPPLFEEVSLLLVPAAPGAAPQGLSATGNPAFQRIWTALGTPCLGFPFWWRDDGLPLGAQIIGPVGGDRQLLADARAIIGDQPFGRSNGGEFRVPRELKATL
ncbi:amidase [Novosphingobium arvoryzae]|uniref:Amidase n=1 Tax=Novosphingobium arvoryzae TaxID=1256514 RepID=A0A918RJ83_9SPHN|nr:amidase [Novosphingobium arvoryzae]GHA02112.1 amidase [Novosphingobium arvoryzae]